MLSRAITRCARRAACLGAGAVPLDRRLAAACVQSVQRFSTKLQRNAEFEAPEVPKPVEQPEVSDVHQENNPFASVSEAHSKYFSTPEGANLYDVRSGAYVSVRPEHLTSYLPEDLTGSAHQEFEFTQNHKWMVRDSTKVLCRLLEEVEATLQNGQAASVPHRGLESVIDIPRLTDRPEWDSATLKYFVRGKELVVPPSATPDAGFVASKGEGSLAENYVSAIKANGVPKKIMLTGERGVGKSVLLNQAVLHARQRGWLCLYIPNGWEHVQSGLYIDPMPMENGTEGIYDNPYMSAKALRGMWHAHAAQLRALPITDASRLQKYAPLIESFREKWSRAEVLHSNNTRMGFIRVREIVLQEDEAHVPEHDELDEDILSKFDIASFKMETLEDLLLVGIALIETAGPAFTDLVAELRNVTSVPVLLAVDGYNTWFEQSAFYYDYQRVQGRQLAVPNALLFLDRHKAATDAYTLKNGLCIAATSLGHPEGQKTTFEQTKRSYEAVMRVPRYNQTEFLSVMSHYLSVTPSDLKMTVSDLQAYRMFVGSAGGATRKDLMVYTLPLIAEQSRDEIETAMWYGNPEDSEDGEDDEDGDDDDDDDEEGDLLEEVVVKGGKKKTK